MRKVIIFDLDSTLADSRQRHHLSPFVDPTKTWDDYSLACGDDTPITGNIALLKILSEIYDIHILTGRRDVARNLTEPWLQKYGANYEVLRMRLDSDDPSNLEYKIGYIEELRKTREVVLIVDDWPAHSFAMEERLKIPVVITNPNYVDLTMSGWDDLLKSIDNGSLHD